MQDKDPEKVAIKNAASDASTTESPEEAAQKREGVKAYESSQARIRADADRVKEGL